jgi:hypothetical protein
MNDDAAESTLDDILNDIDWDILLQDLHAERKAKKLRRENPYILDLIRVLQPRQSGMSRQWSCISLGRTESALVCRYLAGSTRLSSSHASAFAWIRTCSKHAVRRSRKASFAGRTAKAKAKAIGLCSQNADAWLARIMREGWRM